MNKTTEGRQLYLRRLEITDLERTWVWLHRREIYTKIGVKVPFSREEQLIWFEKLQQDPVKIVFAVCRLKDDAHIGNVSLDQIDGRHHNARMSIFIGDESLQGQGCGSEAVQLLLEYAFSTLQLHKVWCKTDAGFPAVIRFYERLGFRQEGVLREHEFKEGAFVDKVLLARINNP